MEPTTYSLLDHNGDSIEDSNAWWIVCQRFREHGYPYDWYILDREENSKYYGVYFVGENY